MTVRDSAAVCACRVGRVSHNDLGTFGFTTGVANVSIVRIGLAETKHFAAGYDAIFGKKRTNGEKKPVARGKSAKQKTKKTKKS